MDGGWLAGVQLERVRQSQVAAGLRVEKRFGGLDAE
jgi:hypothetical protein